MDFKTGKMVEIVREFLANGEDKFEINGVDLSRVIFMYRKKNTNFEPIPKGSYTTKKESNILYLSVDEDIKNKAFEYQIIYITDIKAGKYLEEYPELKVLVSKYNDLVEDVANIIKYSKTSGVKVDTVKMTQVLTPLEPNTFWVMDKNNKIVNFPIGDLNSKYEQMIVSLKKEVEELIKSTKETSILEIETSARNKISEFTEELKKKVNELDVLFKKAQADIKKSVDKLNSNEKEAIKEFERILSEKMSSLNTLSDELKGSLSTAVAKYIADNKESLKGPKGDKGDIGPQGIQGERGMIGPKGDKGTGISHIRTISSNKIEVTYGDNQKEILTMPTVQGPKGDKGDKGDIGPQGIQGERGPKGDTPNIKQSDDASLSRSDTLATTLATSKLIDGAYYTFQQIAGGYYGVKQPPNFVHKGKVRFLMSDEVVDNNSDYKDWIYMDTYQGSDVPCVTAFGISKYSNSNELNAYIMRSNNERTQWVNREKLWHTGNFNPNNKIDKVTVDSLVGFKNGNVGIYCGINNEMNFECKANNLYLNYRTINGMKIDSITLANGDGKGGRGNFYCGSIEATGNGVFTGNLTVQGQILSNDNITAFSDIRLKTNIQKIDNALDKVCKINGYTFNINGKRGTGVIAQELKVVLPEAVTETDTEEKYLSVAYGNIAGLLIEAIKDLKAEIEVLKNDKK